jgi:phage shock protein E
MRIEFVRSPVAFAAFGFLILATCVGVANPGSAEELAPLISAEVLSDRLETAEAPQVIDVRSPAEFETGHVPGAVNIPHDELAGRLDEVDAEHGVVLYCMVGPRARLGEATLRSAGVSGLLHLDGGLAAWRDVGLPTEPPRGNDGNQ